MSEILCRLDHAGLFLPGDTERKPILRDITWDIHAGEHSVLIGGNGAGKSTLMKLMVGLLKPNSGTVSLFGEAIGDKKAEDLSRQISLVYQNPEEMFIKDSIRADIAYAIGYNEPHYFSYIFKKYTGISPSVYRKQAQ